MFILVLHSAIVKTIQTLKIQRQNTSFQQRFVNFVLEISVIKKLLTNFLYIVKEYVPKWETRGFSS